MTIPEALQRRSEYLLDELMRRLPGLSAAVLASSDGFEVAARARDEAEVAKLAAMSCSISALGAMAGIESGIGRCQSVTIEADEGYIVIIEVPHEGFPMIMNLVAPTSEILGQVLYHAKRAAADLALAN